MASNLNSTTHSSNTLGKTPPPVPVRSKQIAVDGPDVAMETYIATLNVAYYNRLNKHKQEEYLEKFDALELFMVVQDVKRELAAVKLENHFLTDFLENNDPKLLIGLQQRRNTASIHLQQQQEEEEEQEEGEEEQQHHTQHRLTITSATLTPRSSATNVRRSTSRRSVATVNQSQSANTINATKRGNDFRLNFKAKTEMAEKAAADLERKVRNIEDTAMKEIKRLNANMEELRYRTEETDETAKNFRLHFLTDQRDIIFLGKATEKQIERKFRKFINNWIKNARSLLATMRLRITTLQESCQFHRNLLIAKADLSGILGGIDFEQLKIKRTDYQKSLDEKNAHMAGLKGVTGKASLSMSEEKQEMMNIEDKSHKITIKTTDIIKAISKLDKEADTVEEENKKANKTLHQLKDQLGRFDAPSVNEYIERKNELVFLEKEDKLLQRKIPLLNMKITTLSRECKRRDDDTDDDEDESEQ